MLTEHARIMLLDLGVTEGDVLERCHRGLVDEHSAFSAVEAGWVVLRLAELLEWRAWQPPAPAGTND